MRFICIHDRKNITAVGFAVLVSFLPSHERKETT